MRPTLHSWELDCEAAVKAELEVFRQPLMDDFSRFNTTPPAAVGCLNFTIYSRYYGFPVSVFAMDAECINQVFEVPEEWRRGLLADFEGDLISEELQEELDSYEALAIFLAEFTGACWYQTMGSEYPIPVLANHHDRSRYFDCSANSWK